MHRKNGEFKHLLTYKEGGLITRVPIPAFFTYRKKKLGIANILIKRIIITILFVLLVVAAIAGVKALQIKAMIDGGAHFQEPPVTVTTATVATASWQARLTSLGALEAVQGLVVSAELPGKITAIGFEAGSQVEKGDLLVQQDVSLETAQLREAEAAMELARLNRDRARNLVAKQTIPRADLDHTEAQLEQARARAEAIRATIAKKKIVAPFSGRLGLRLVNLGQTINSGQPIVPLQRLDPIFVNFSLPQQYAQVEAGYDVEVTSDALPGQVIRGKITAMNPEADAATRSIRLQATLANESERLRPGTFANVAVILPESGEVLAVPATAVLFAPYGDSVFLVETPADGTGLVLRQQFVQLGERRGDFVALTSGVSAGETVVSTGVFKLRNGQPAVVDNTLNPDFKLDPSPEDK